MYANACKIMHKFGVFALFRKVARNKAAILMYHNLSESKDIDNKGVQVNVDAFYSQMKYLKRYYEVISLSKLVKELAVNKNIKPNYVAVTFDDGYLNNYRYAWPICKELGVPFTVYVATDFVDKQELLWPDRLRIGIKESRTKLMKFELLGSAYELSISTVQEKEAAYRVISRILKKMDLDLLDDFVIKIEKTLGVDTMLKSREVHRPCTWDQLGEMIDSGIVEIGSHTVGHPILSHLNPERVKFELENSKKQIERNIGTSCKHFAYPNGKQEDFNVSISSKVRELGYDSAVTTLEGFCKPGNDLYALPRFGVYGQYSDAQFLGSITGFHGCISRILLRPT